MTDKVDSRESAHRPLWRRPLVIVGALVVLVVGGFIAVYTAFFSGSSPARLTLDSVPTTTTAAGGSTATTSAPRTGVAGRWAAASGSVAGYRVREKLASLPAQSDAVGRTSAVSGAMTVVANGDALVARDLRIEVDLTQLKSDETRRDNRIRTDGLESTKFPTSTFVSTSEVSVPADAATGKQFTVELAGDLTLHGVTKRVTIPVQGQVGADGLQVAGSLDFAMSMFDISPPNVGGFVSVEPNATIEFKINMKPA